MNTQPSCQGIRVDRVQTIADRSGTLLVAEAGRHVPFPIARTFVVSGVAAGTRRGHHAHKQCHQLLVCLAGRISVLVHDGSQSLTLELSEPGACVHILPGIWAEQTYETAETTLLVLCDQPYDESDYLRDFQDFLAWRAGEGKGRSQP